MNFPPQDSHPLATELDRVEVLLCCKGSLWLCSRPQVSRDGDDQRHQKEIPGKVRDAKPKEGEEKHAGPTVGQQLVRTWDSPSYKHKAQLE